MTGATAVSISETARERETFKYDSLFLSTSARTGGHPPKSIPSAFLSDAPDPALTAFAQLGLLKLNAARAMVSFFDRSHQHIVAEAIRSPPPGGASEPIWFNGLTFERRTSVCEHVVTGAAAGQSIPGNEFGLTAGDIPVSVVKHLDTDSRFCDIRDPGRQFYAGVPIRSPTGINIGVYCVFDDKPRPEGLSTDEVRFIRDISRVVMEYLESKRSHEWYRREQRMVRGLGSFVKGQATIWNWAEGAEDQLSSYKDLPGMTEGLLNKKLQSATDVTEQSQQSTHFKQEVPAAEAVWPRSRSTGHDDGDAHTGVAAAPSLKAGESPEIPKLSPPKLTRAKSHTGPTDLLRNNVGRVFSKAANVVREALEVEGVLFLDANIRFHGGLVGSPSSKHRNSFVKTQSSSGLSSSDDGASSQSQGHQATAHSTCDVLGFSTSQASSVVGDPVPGEFTRCKEQFLLKLLRRYPSGQIWNFEADGAISDHSTGSDSDSSVAKTIRAPPSPPKAVSTQDTDAAPSVGPKARLSTASRIIQMFPGARSVAVVPLWDVQAGRWFAGGIIWTRTPTRAFTDENELTYLRVFGLTTMAEVARLKTQAAEKTKTDILDSISHELRSPLHGLIGAADLMKLTSLDAVQDGIMRTIEASGRTLLDTIDHLLDYAILNAASSSRSGQRSRVTDLRQRPSLSIPAKPPPPELPVHLDLLAEEVVESVLAGSNNLTRPDMHSPFFSTTSTKPYTLSTADTIAAVAGRRKPDDRLGSTRSAAQIYLDIDQPANWSFRMHPGAFRRIVMNLFGNSLKFTSSGFIRISMHQETVQTRLAASHSRRVVLTVSDSGRGMSQHYLNHHLFTPFSQEDQFAQGTGLGLSLVRHMTTSLGGTIDVWSKLGQGTTITVTLPLPHEADNMKDEDDESFWDDTKTLAGRRVRLGGFERDAQARESLCTYDANPRSQYQLVERMCRNMLGMSVMSDDNTDRHADPPDFVICATGNGPAELDAAALQYESHCPYIFVCENLLSIPKLTGSKRGALPLVSEFCSQPLGPRKLARALLDAQLHWRSSLGTNQSEASQPEVDSISIQHVQHSVDSAVDSANDSANDSATDSLVPSPQSIRPDQERLDETSIELPLITIPNGYIRNPPAASEPLSPKSTEPIALQVDTPVLHSVESAQRGRILVVDDNAINLKIMAAYAAKLQHPYTTAINGLEAFEAYSKAPADYSCVLTDISMPVMDGLESTRLIREFDRTHQRTPVAVIALTGLSGDEVRKNALASGVDLFLTRPLTLHGLSEALSTMGLR